MVLITDVIIQGCTSLITARLSQINISKCIVFKSASKPQSNRGEDHEPCKLELYCTDALSDSESVTVRIMWIWSPSQKPLFSGRSSFWSHYGTEHEAHSWVFESWKSATRWLRAEVKMSFSTLQFLMIHYRILWLSLQIMEATPRLRGAKFHLPLIIIKDCVFCTNVECSMVLCMYPLAFSALGHSPFRHNKIYPEVHT